VTAEEYAALQAAIAAAAVAYATQFASLFSQAALSVSEWLRLLQIMYPQVEQYRSESAELARRFYDSQRAQFHPELPRHDQYAEDYRIDWFVESMEPVRKKFSQPNTPDAVVGEFVALIAREVENAGRRQIIHAVESDEPVAEKVQKVQERRVEQPVTVASDPRPVQGWARIATGNETCAWCLMLVSRGPVYPTAKSAGSKYDSETSLSVLAGESDIGVEDMMNQWHTGCDCKVVPVFDEADWPGKPAQERASELWNDAYDDAVEWRERYPDRVHATGKKKGKRITIYEDQLLALRRRVDGGLINSQEWAAIQAA
jgi:hypothetical protein